jgi:hypothetical protein
VTHDAALVEALLLGAEEQRDLPGDAEQVDDDRELVAPEPEQAECDVVGIEDRAVAADRADAERCQLDQLRHRRTRAGEGLPGVRREELASAAHGRVRRMSYKGCPPYRRVAQSGYSTTD